MTILDILNVISGEMFYRNGWNVDALIHNLQMMIVLIGSNPFFS